MKVHPYSYRIKNDDYEAVRLLDNFTKAFCINVEIKDDLVFRCKECPFEVHDEVHDGICLLKIFKHKFAPKYKNFGSMGDL